MLEANNRMEWRGKELEDVDTEQRDERVMESQSDEGRKMDMGWRNGGWSDRGCW